MLITFKFFLQNGYLKGLSGTGFDPLLANEAVLLRTADPSLNIVQNTLHSVDCLTKKIRIYLKLLPKAFEKILSWNARSIKFNYRSLK